MVEGTLEHHGIDVRRILNWEEYHFSGGVTSEQADEFVILVIFYAFLLLCSLTQ